VGQRKNAMLVGVAAVLCSLLGATSAAAEPGAEPIPKEGFGDAGRFVNADGSRPGFEFPPVPYDWNDDYDILAIAPRSIDRWTYALGVNAAGSAFIRQNIDTGDLDATLPSSPVMGPLAPNSDGTRIYSVGTLLNDSNTCALAVYLVGGSWSVLRSWTPGSGCGDVVSVPGAADRVVVSTRYQGMFTVRGGVVEAGSWTPALGEDGYLHLTMGAGGVFYASNSTSLRKFTLTDNGVAAQAESVALNWLWNNADNWRAQRPLYSSGRVIAGRQVLDASSLAPVGTLPSPPGFAEQMWQPMGVDATTIYALQPESVNSFEDDDIRVHLFDLASLRYIDSMSFIDAGHPNAIPEGGFVEVSPGVFAFASYDGLVIGFLGKRRGSAGEFTSLTPQRLLDSRLGIGRPSGSRSPLGAGKTFELQITGQAGVPTSGVSSVVLNVTGTSPDKDTYLSVYPAGIAPPDISNINLRTGETRPNLVTVKVGASGQVSVFNAFGNVHVIADVAGYYSTSEGQPGSRFVPVSPTRVIDTRTAALGPKQPLGDSVPLEFSLAGRGLPSTGMTAVAMNVTITRPTVASYLTVYPGDVARPEVSNLNYIASDTVPNQVIVRLPPNGVLKFENDAGTTDLIVDVVGYYHLNDSNERGRFFPTTPVRFLDTRIDQIFPGDGKVWSDEGVVVTYPDEPYAAWVMNVTVVDAEAEGYITVYPEPGNPPNASNLNFRAGQTLPNHVVSPTGPGVGWYNFGGEVHILADYFGGFT
jgi:hypothetical protein